VEAEGPAGDQPDLGVDRFDAGVGERVTDCRFDFGALLFDGVGEPQERRELALARPHDPGAQQVSAWSVGSR
jgi:hypothetical protein